ncbi:hypothetical protein ACFRCG_17525 [Embleya sp. NPDC056575]|uniref:hypothetical protein n=1 Tax=unclassified Embleya TaxID=2699296 RepID=UPI00368CC8AC
MPSRAPEVPSVPRNVVPVWATPAEGKSIGEYKPDDFDPNKNKNSDVPRDKALGTWASGSTLFVVRGTAVTMLDIATGREIGRVTPPAPGLKPCAMTEGVNKDGVGGIAWTVYDDGTGTGVCKQLSFVDTRKGGTVLRTVEFAGKKRKDGSPWHWYSASIGFVGDDLVAVMTPTSVIAFRVGDGTTAWTWENRSKDPSVFPDTRLIAPVHNTAMKTGPDLVAVISDSNQRGSGHDPELVTLDAAGRQIGAQPTPVDGPSEDADAEIVALQPLTLLFPRTLGDDFAPQIVRFDRDGTRIGAFSLESPQGPVDSLGARTLHDHKTSPFQVVGNTLYAVTAKDLDTRVGGPGVVAFDLTSGRLLWNVPGTDWDRPILVRSDDKGVLVLTPSLQGIMLGSYAAADGRMTTVSEAPRAEPRKGIQADSIVDLVEGRILVTGISPIGFGTQAFAAG